MALCLLVKVDVCVHAFVCEKHRKKSKIILGGRCNSLLFVLVLAFLHQNMN